ncbi:MAG: PKD domain-containing protein [Saprospiraceae bacterium]|nr:PKD domain-containing protein [Saprospiraceae bacterium]
MRIIYLIGIINISVFNIFCQKSEIIYPNIPENEIHIHKGSDLFTTPSSGSLLPENITEDWNISLRHFSSYFHNDELPLEEYKKLKEEANEVRNQQSSYEFPLKNSQLKSDVSPILMNNFRANIRGGSIPMDNTMAISRNGFVVSAINSNIIFTMPDGVVTFSRSLADFYKLLALGTRMFDPRVIYDPEQNRFIVVCLHGSSFNTSYLCIAFSQTEDPNGEWNFYKIKGNPMSDEVWFDFPNIALSKDDLYIAGNMFNDDNQFRYSMILQISKTDGYEGNELTWKYYGSNFNSPEGITFNPVPVMSGWENLTTPGLYFISRRNNGYNINYTTESVKNNPSLATFFVSGPVNAPPPEGRQKGVDVMLNTGGTRLRHAIYLNGILHFMSQSNSPTGDGGLFYGRLNLNTLKVNADVLFEKDRDYTYPTLTAFGSSEEDDKILVNYTFSGPDIFPGQAVRVVSGYDNEFNWGDEVIYKNGTSPIGYTGIESIRWGDYTGASRRFGTGRIESWSVGCFGEGSGHSNWFGQFVSNTDLDRPVMEFTASKTTTRRDSLITFRDISNVTPTSRLWLFEGGSPATSTEELPEIMYEQNGAFNVTLISYFEGRTDTMTKKEFIHILEPVSKPEALWTFDRDVVYIGDTIRFTSLSSANSQTHKWTFISGTPNNSADKNPTIVYNKKGSFLVSLTVANTAGSSTSTVNKAITVLEKLPPKALFTANKVNIISGESIIFNETATGAKNLHWTFTGGIPETSGLRSPVVIYPEEGSFPVTLVVSNDFGTDSITLENYINVGTSSTNSYASVADLKLYPNPVLSSQNEVSLALNNVQSGIFKIDLYNQNGSLVKTLYNDKIKNGSSILTFRTSMLSAGSYFISVTSDSIQYRTMKLYILD